MTPAVVLTSAGLDSTTALALAVREHNPVYAVWANYGSTHNPSEEQALPAIVDWFVMAGHEVELVKVQLPDIFKGSGSTLMGEQEMRPHEQVGPSHTIVPFRNGNLISAAATIAVTKGASHVWVGMHAEDHKDWAYPDCSPEFLGAMASALYIGTYPVGVRLAFPLIWSMKKDVVLLAHSLGVPAHLTHTCYTPVIDHVGEPPDVDVDVVYACGKCPSCIERLGAFQAAGLVDPLPYAVPVDWNDCDAYVI